MQILFDQHGWTSRVGMTRWLVRCTNTVRNHNNPRYARNTHTMLGPDKWRWLFLAASMGGELSVRSRVEAGARVREVHLEIINDDMLEPQQLHADAVESTRRLLHYRIDNYVQASASPLRPRAHPLHHACMHAPACTRRTPLKMTRNLQNDRKASPRGHSTPAGEAKYAKILLMKQQYLFILPNLGTCPPNLPPKHPGAAGIRGIEVRAPHPGW